MIPPAEWAWELAGVAGVKQRGGGGRAVVEQGGVHFRKHVKGLKLRASAKRSKGKGWGKKWILCSPPSHTSPPFFAHPFPFSRFFAYPRRVRLLSSFARSPRLENGKGISVPQAREAFFATSPSPSSHKRSLRVGTYYFCGEYRVLWNRRTRRNWVKKSLLWISNLIVISLRVLPLYWFTSLVRSNVV